MRARLAFVAAVLSFLGLEATSFAADKCFPACRPGFLCSPQGTCVSECNPPCAGGETCTSGGHCKSNSSAGSSSDTPRAAATPAPAAAPQAPASTNDAPTLTEPRTAALMGGFAVIFGGATVATSFGFTGTLQFKTEGNHAFIVGPRLGVFFPTGYVFGTAGVDLGYRGNLAKSASVEAGPLVMLQPNVAFGVKNTIPIAVPLTVGGFVHYGAFEAQVLIGGGPLIYTGNFGFTTGMGTFVLNAGYAF